MATIRDVAKSAGVAPSTVSHVLNGTAPISGETRERVLRAVEKLDYHPRRRINTLAFGTQRRIGILTDAIADPLASAIINGAISMADSEGFVAAVAQVNLDSPFRSFDALGPCMGILVISSVVKVLPWFPDVDVPIVFSYCSAEKTPYLSVIPDDFRGAYDATRYLIGLGHRKIAFINGPEGWLSAQERLAGYRAALEEADIVFEPQLVRVGDWGRESGYKAVRGLLTGYREGRSVTAILAASDYMAVGVLRACVELGLNVPGDVAIIGFDDRECAVSTTPLLTTVRLPLEEMGRLAARELIKLIQRGSKPSRYGDSSRIQLRCPLVIRESCGGSTYSHRRS